MKSKLLGAMVAPISILGLTFALGLGTSAFGTTGAAEKQSLDDTLINTLNVTTEIEVAPWCGWYVSTSAGTSLALEPDAGEPTTYTGLQIALTKTADTNTAYVGPTTGLTVEGLETACSWFTEGNKYGARYDVVANGDTFTATALNTIDGTVDPGMNFYATESNVLKITNIGIESCAPAFVTSASASLYGTTLTTTPWTVSEAAVTNNNFCQWSAKYEIKIPGSMSPLYGNVNYRWNGPTLTHTLIIPETQGL